MEVNYTQYYNTKNLKLDPNASPQGVFKYKDLPETIDDPNVHFIVAQHDAQSVQFPVADENKSSWSEATTQNSKRLSYLAQFFARELRESNPNIPIGIIQTAWGGTAISRHIKGGDIYKNHIAPLQGFHVAGVLWYQGCNDAANNATALAYESQFTALINQYRKVFDDASLPFLYVQLARWDDNQYTQVVRQAQLSTLDNPNLNSTGNVGMTVSMTRTRARPKPSTRWARRFSPNVWPTSGKPCARRPRFLPVRSSPPPNETKKATSPSPSRTAPRKACRP